MNSSDNLWKYYFLRVFTKQMIVPVLVIFLLARGLSPASIGILFSIGTIIGVILEVPSGFISDKIGHKNAIAISFLLQAISMLVYTWSTSFTLFMLATALYATGSSFWSGTADALVFETLKGMNRENEYERIQGRSIAISQPISASFLIVVPFLYTYNKLFPFYLNFAFLALAFVISLTLVQPTFVKSVSENKGFKKAIEDIGRVKDYIVRNKRFSSIMTFFSMSDALQDAFDQFGQIYFQFVRLPAQFFGFVYASNRISQGLGGSLAHRAKRKMTQFSGAIGLNGIITGFFILAGLIRHWLGVILFPIRNFFEGLFDPIQSGYLNEEITAGDRIALLSVSNLLSALFRAVLLLIFGFLFNAMSVPHVLEITALGGFVLLLLVALPINKHFGAR